MATKTPYELEQERLRQQQQAQAVNQQQAAPAPVVPGAPAPTPMLANFQNAPQGQYQMAPDVQNAYQIYQGMLGAKPGAYQSQYQPQMDALFQQFQNRKPFEYDMNADTLYQQMKDQYAKNAKMSMQDTMGQAASMTGGYGSSYGQIAGQQAYDQQMTQLHNNIPALSDRKYAQYQDEGNQMLSQFGMAGQLEGQQYGQYRDSYGDWFNEAQMAGNRYDSERGFDYGKYRDTVGDTQWQNQFDYGKYRDTVADTQWGAQFDWQKQMDTAQQNFQQAQFEWQKATDARDYQAAEYWKNQQTEYQKEMDALSQQNWQSEFDYGAGQDQKQQAFGLAMAAIQGGRMPDAGALAAAGIDQGIAKLLTEIYTPKASGSGSRTTEQIKLSFTPYDIEKAAHEYQKGDLSGLDWQIEQLILTGADPNAAAILRQSIINNVEYGGTSAKVAPKTAEEQAALKKAMGNQYVDEYTLEMMRKLKK